VIYAVFVALNWPFRKQRLIDVLQEATLRTVTVGKFQKTFFPPGCVAEDISFERHLRKDQPPVIHIQALTVQASWARVLTGQYHLSLVRAVNMHVLVPPAKVNGKPDPLMPLNRTPSRIRTLNVDRIIADGTILDFAHEDGSKPYRIGVDKLVVYDVSNNSAIHYKTIITNSVPPGKIHSTGVFGPWHPDDPGQTPVEGTYSYNDANLAAFSDFSGRLNATGRMKGRLGEIFTQGTADVKNFHVSETSHTRELKANYKARVDGTHGDTMLDDVEAQFNDSSLTVKGRIAGETAQKGKTVSLDLLCSRGRIEDVLDLFIQAQQAPMIGPVTMKAHLEVPPGKEGFIRRMHMTGDFGVDNGKFTDNETQADLNRLSASADRKKPAEGQDPIALSDLRGHGDIQNGIAHLTHVKFSVPGATAEVEGTYSLTNYDVNLVGTLYTDGNPWTATTGFKSFFVRIITPFLKKKHDIRIVPFKLTGNYHHMTIGLDLGRKKQIKEQLNQ
jgi:hypothetical protein